VPTTPPKQSLSYCTNGLTICCLMENFDALEQALARERLRRRLPGPEVRRLLRESAGVSQTELARALDVDRASVSRWKSGARCPGPAVMPRYIAALERLARARGTETAP
jgi:DNA-binding transcriptional regulator YiaG